MTFEGKCFALSSEGKGLVKYNNKLVIVDNLLVDEIANIEIYKELSKCSYGKVIKYIQLSSCRVKPLCPFYDKCGGCALQHIPYEKQIEFKKNEVKSFFKKLANTDIEISDFITSPEYEYRNKIELQVSNNSLGYYNNGSHCFTPIDRCLLVDEHTNYLIEKINEILKETSPDIKSIIIRKSFIKRQTMIIFVSSKKDFANKEDFIWKLKNLHVTTIIQNINNDPKKDMSMNNIVIEGKGYIEDEISGYTFIVSPSSFYQVNSFITDKLYKTAIDMLNANSNEHLLDAYCGVGTIGLLASNNVKSVVGVEINKLAIEDANINKEINNVSNITFVAEDAKSYIKKDKDSNILIIDPPRAGCDKEFIDTILNKEYSKIVYISCNYQTLARDYNLLKEKYNLDKVVLADMFPNTGHVETVASLKIKV